MTDRNTNQTFILVFGQLLAEAIFSFTGHRYERPVGIEVSLNHTGRPPLSPDGVDVVTGGQQVGHHFLSGAGVPVADDFGHDVDAISGVKHFFGSGLAVGVDAGAGHAVNHDHIP